MKRRKVEIYIRDSDNQSVRVLCTDELIPIPSVGDTFTVEHHRFNGTGENKKRYKVLERHYSYELAKFSPSEARHGVEVCNVMLKCETVYEEKG